MLYIVLYKIITMIIIMFGEFVGMHIIIIQIIMNPTI